MTKIPCPYCGTKFAIDATHENAAPAELEALPYARDIKLFDPGPQENSKTKWTRIGENFFSPLHYERLGILHMEPEWHVRYCVARCPLCKRLMDVFANFTEDKSLSDIWPHLLSRNSLGVITPWTPTSILIRLFNNTEFVPLFFAMVYFSSLIPYIIMYSDHSRFDVEEFLLRTWPVLLIRGMVVLFLLYILSVRNALIQTFKNTESLCELFRIDRKLLSYWANFCVCRFTGYQKQGQLLTFNAVMLFGGVSSCLILVVAWVIIRVGAPLPSLGVMAAELAFWLIVAYGFGIVFWNLSAIPAYVFEGMTNLPIDIDRWHTEGVTVIDKARRYSERGVYALIMSFIALSMLPIITPDFDEERWAIIWAQSLLVSFSTMLIIRYKLRTTTDIVDKTMHTVVVIGVILLYIVVKYIIEISNGDGNIMLTFKGREIMKWIDVKHYAEVLVFIVLTAYLFNAMEYNKKKVLKQIRKNAIGEEYSERVKKPGGDPAKAWEIREEQLKALEKGESNARSILVILLPPICGAVIGWLMKHFLGGDL